MIYQHISPQSSDITDSLCEMKNMSNKSTETAILKALLFCALVTSSSLVMGSNTNQVNLTQTIMPEVTPIMQLRLLQEKNN